MDNDTLKRLFSAGAILLVLDAPKNQLEFGIDINCWNTGPRFKGIKIIPPGPHFVYYSLHNGQSETPNDAEGTVEVKEGGTTGGQVRVGFWHVFESGEVVVMKWNAYNEEMELEQDKDQIARYKAGIYEFDPFLGAYPLLPPDSTYPAWLKLSDHIKQSTVSSVFVAEGFVDSYDDQIEEELSKAQQTLDRQQKAEAAQAAQNDKNSESSTSQKRTTDTILEESEDTMEVEQPSTASGSSKSAPAKRELVKRSTTVKFTPINLRASFRKGAVGEEVTRYSLDKSWLLNHLFTSAYHSDVSRFLGEYQAAFTTMLLCYHLGAFRQWKAMTILVCQSAEATPSPNFTNFFVAFIKTLDSQLASIPSSFFTDLLFASSDEADITANFVEISLKSLGRNILSGLRHGHCAELRKPMRQLQKSVMETFEWKISGDFKKASTKVVEIDVNNVPLMSDDDEYEEEGEYAPVIVE